LRKLHVAGKKRIGDWEVLVESKRVDCPIKEGDKKRGS